jgi:hypothetical protein
MYYSEESSYFVIESKIDLKNEDVVCSSLFNAITILST